MALSAQKRDSNAKKLFYDQAVAAVKKAAVTPVVGSIGCFDLGIWALRSAGLARTPVAAIDVEIPLVFLFEK